LRNRREWLLLFHRNATFICRPPQRFIEPVCKAGVGDGLRVCAAGSP
jgi:hypothetical protein